ncbi:hypothetical protein PI125_g10998 [Phytophthora idaei]|nr:hypothetical protein PI125_g10998 [Phytophthora idaei]
MKPEVAVLITGNAPVVGGQATRAVWIGDAVDGAPATIIIVAGEQYSIIGLPDTGDSFSWSAMRLRQQVCAAVDISLSGSRGLVAAGLTET